MTIGTEGGTPKDTAIDDARYERMKHLRIDHVTWVKMVPILQAEGLLPDHRNHETMPVIQQGRRSEARNAEVCRRCEDLIQQQWTRNVPRLRFDEVALTEARWLWLRAMEKLEAIALRDYHKRTVRRTIKRIRGEGEDGKKIVTTEITEQIEWRIIPALLAEARSIRNDIARLSGVPVGEVDETESPDTPGDNRADGALVVKRPAGRGDPVRVN